MSFDHVAVAFAMLMSLSVVRLLDSLRPALVPGRRYWVHTVWIVQKIVSIALYWWIFWWLREGVVWTAASFLWILLAPGLMFLQASALATTHPGTVPSWHDHFYEIRRWFFSADIGLILHSIVTSSLLRDVPLLDPLRAVQATGLVLSIAGVSSARPRLHAAIAPTALAVQLLGLGSLFFVPQGYGV